MRRKGRSFLDCEISRIVSLLMSTDMSINDIAQRMHCSVSAVNALNRRLNVRHYEGRRTSWTYADKVEAERELKSA